MSRIALLRFLRFALPAIAVSCVAVFVVPARGQHHIGNYPRMAPLAQYMMATNAEIALARSAAPSSISKEARVLILTSNGYATPVNGKNDFTCLVERNWMSAFDDSQFWNPKGRGAICYNPAASRTVLRYDYTRALPAHAGTGLNDGAGNWYPHLMFHVPQADGANAGASWGANLPASPVVMDSAHKLWPEPQTVFFVPLGKWSDGTPGPP